MQETQTLNGIILTLYKPGKLLHRIPLDGFNAHTLNEDEDFKDILRITGFHKYCTHEGNKEAFINRCIRDIQASVLDAPPDELFPEICELWFIIK